MPSTVGSTLELARVADLERRLTGHDGLLVAFSGGADSAYLLAVAVRVLGSQRVVAATAVSPSLPAAELAAAAVFADALGVEHLQPATRELEREGYRANGTDRCYFCKAELMDTLAPVAAGRGLTVATGTNADDAVAGFRPGIRAADERGVIAPLRDAGLTKAQVRAASRRLGLTTWDKPAAACLASRIAYGQPVTAAGLRRIEDAEGRLRRGLAAAGHRVVDLRVRDLGAGAARIEVDPELVAPVRDDPVLLGSVGFDRVAVGAFRSGSMNAGAGTPPGD